MTNNSLTHTHKLGNKQFSSYLKSEQSTATACFNIEKYLQNYDSFYYNCLLWSLKGKPLPDIQNSLNEELSALLSGKSFLHRMNHAIESRHNCINKIKRQLTKTEEILKVFKKVYYAKHQTQHYEALQAAQEDGFAPLEVEHELEHSISVIRVLFSDMNRLRDMTVYVIQSIHRWRMELEEWMDKCGQHSRVDFYYQGEVFYRTLHDTDFIWTSHLREYIWLEEKHDPLLIENLLKLEEREEKEVLEKYMIEILYPKNDQILEKGVRCLEMLTFQYQPKKLNLFEEEEKLIENYLSLEREPLAGPSEKTEYKSPMHHYEEEQDEIVQAKMHPRGWIFGKSLSKPTTNRVRQIINKHEQKMRYDNNRGKQYKRSAEIMKIKKVNIFDESKFSLKKTPTIQKKKNIIKRKPEDLQQNKPRGYKSLTKINTLVIPEDPKEEDIQTPKKFRKPLNHQIKINTFTKEGDGGEALVVDNEETPITMRQFFQVFRADTAKPVQNNTERQWGSQKKLKSREYDRSVRIKMRRDKSSKKQKTVETKEKHQPSSLEKNYQKVQEPLKQEPKKIKNTQFIRLKPKQITKDTIRAYVQHLMKHLPNTTRCFTNYSQRKLLAILEDEDIYSMIFELEAEKSGVVGQVIVTQNLTRNSKLSYRIEFINIANFDILLDCLWRVSEQFLSSTPAQQVLIPLRQDKFDPVSSHFIQLIDQGLRGRAHPFYLHILQRKMTGLLGEDNHERLYMVETTGKPKQHLIKDYRSVRIESSCVVFSSNFKLRSDSNTKNTIDRYGDWSIGRLFVRILASMMNQHNLKQLKLGLLNDSGSRTSLFFRTVFEGLLSYLKEEKSEKWDYFNLIQFTNMTDVLNYLNYRQYDRMFRFEFLNESRFILNHQLRLVEFNLSTSLQMRVKQTPSMLIIRRRGMVGIETVGGFGYLFPTGDESVRLLVMSGEEYMKSTGKMDLFSYVEWRVRGESVWEMPEGEVVLPNLSRNKPKTTSLQNYQGFLSLFPEPDFYSATHFFLSSHHHPYPPSILPHPSSDAVLIDYPLIVSFYHYPSKTPLVSLLYAS